MAFLEVDENAVTANCLLAGGGDCRPIRVFIWTGGDER